MPGPNRTNRALATLAVLCFVLAGCQENTRQNGRADVEPVAAPSEDLVVPSRTSMATAAVRHAYEELISRNPELGETPPTVDPTHSIPGGDESLDQEAMIAHVARAIDARIARWADVVSCPGGNARDCRIRGSRVVFQIRELEIEGERGRVEIRLSLEQPEIPPARIYSSGHEYVLEFREGAWEVVDHNVDWMS